MRETWKVSTLQETRFRKDGTGATYNTHHHGAACTSWSAGRVTTAETLAMKNKSTSLNELQRALCPSKETMRGLQLKKVESMVPSRGTSLAKFHLPR